MCGFVLLICSNILVLKSLFHVIVIMLDLVSIDTSGIASLEELHKNLVSSGKQVRRTPFNLRFYTVNFTVFTSALCLFTNYYKFLSVSHC